MRERLQAAARSAAMKRLAAGIIFVASRKWSEGERDDDAATGNRKAELPTVLLAAPLLFFLFQIAGEPYEGNTEDAGEDGKLIIGNETVAGLNAADCLSPQTDTIDLHLGGKDILG